MSKWSSITILSTTGVPTRPPSKWPLPYIWRYRQWHANYYEKSWQNFLAHNIDSLKIIYKKRQFRAHVRAVSLPLSPASINSLFVVDFFVLTLCFSTVFLYILCWQINLIWFDLVWVLRTAASRRRHMELSVSKDGLVEQHTALVQRLALHILLSLVVLFTVNICCVYCTFHPLV